jgi:5-methylcytosine-specific restriction endonuclease McrA
MLKTCTKCLREQNVAEFRKKPNSLTPNSRCKACEAEYQREHYWRFPEKGRAKAAKSMRKLRADPVKRTPHLERRRRDWAAKWKAKEQAALARMREEKPWEWRVKNLKRNVSKEITLEWLRATWSKQDGKCALSGRSLDIATAEVDHIVPTCRGGTDDLRNLRLVAPEANASKHGMTDDELIALCRNILAHAQIPELIGRAILASAAA